MSISSYFSERVPLQPDDSSRKWSRFAVVWFGGVGFLAPIAVFIALWFYNTFVTRGALPTQWPSLGVTVLWLTITAASGGAVGGLVWHLVVERIERGAVWAKAVVAGGLTAEIAAVPINFFYFLLLPNGIFDDGILEAAVGALVFGGLYGIFLYGWMTIPLGIVSGYVLGSVRTGES